MKRILPFKALRYNRNILGDLRAALSPAYDTLSSGDVEKLYDRHPFNAVRLDKSMAAEGDSDVDNKYTRSAETLMEWTYSGVLLPDKQQSVYVCGVKSEDEKKNYCGFICLVHLDGYEAGRIVSAGEGVGEEKADRLGVMMACSANFSMIYSVYEDEDKASAGILMRKMQEIPVSSVKTEDGATKELWQITDEQTISQVTKILEDKKLFVVDGQSTFEAAISYRDIMRKKNPEHTGREPYNYAMMVLMCADCAEENLFPAYRMVKNLAGFNEQGVTEQLGKTFEVKQVEGEDIPRGDHLVMYTGKDYFYTLKLKEEMAEEENSFEKMVLEDALGMTGADIKNQTYLSYGQDICRAMNAVKSGEYQCCFIAPSVKLCEITGEGAAKLPPKWTCVDRKIPSGLVIYKIS